MTIELFANVAKSRLASGISDVDTSLTVTTGHGVRFRSPGAGQIGRIVLKDASGNYEICTYTGRTSDTLTGLTRGAESTTARAWSANDLVEMRITRSTMEGLSQLDADETNTGDKRFSGELTAERGVNVFAVSGTDTYTGTLAPAISGYVLGVVYAGYVTNANTSTTPTLNLNGIGAKTIIRDDSGGALQVGDIGATRMHYFIYDGTYMRLLNPTKIRADANLPGDPTTTTQSVTDNSTKVATTAYVKSQIGESNSHQGTIKFNALNIPQNATRFLGGLGVSVDSTEANRQFPLLERIPIQIKDVKVLLSSAVPASQTCVVNVRINGTTFLTGTLNAGETTLDIDGPSAVIDGSDYTTRMLSVGVVTSATFGNTNDISVTLRAVYAGTDIAVPILILGSQTDAEGSGHATEMGSSSNSSTGGRFNVPLAESVLGMKVRAYTVGVGVMDVYRNDVSVFSDSATAGDYADNMLYFADDDLFRVVNTTEREGVLSLSFSPNNDGAITYFPVGNYSPLLFSSYAQAQNQTLYMSGYGQTGDSTEANVKLRFATGVIKKLRGTINSAVTGSDTVVVTLRKNGVDTGLTITFDVSTGVNLVETDLVNEVSILDTDEITFSCALSATTGTKYVNISVEHHKAA